MRNKILIGILLSCTIFGAKAMVVEVQPGELAAKMAENLTETSLTVSGNVDVRDFKFINESLTKLSQIDLSNVNIVAYEGTEAYFGDETSYEANSLPSLSFFNLPLTTVVLPNSLTSIGNGAFSACRALSSIQIPNGVVTIGDYCFYDCDVLTDVEIPSSVESIGKYGFNGCDNLKSINISSTKSGFEIAPFTFMNCKLLESVTIPASTSIIGESAFMGCDKLSSFTFPPSLKSIEDSAFKGAKLKTVDVSECTGLTTIGDWAFADNDNLLTIKLSKNISNIGEGAFFMSENLTSISMPENINTINDYLFTGSKTLKNAETIIPDSITKIGKYAFAYWTNALKYQIPASVEMIDDNAFDGNTSLKEIRILTTTVPQLGNEVFNNVDQPNVKLYVNEGLETPFRNADQWKNFDIPTYTGVGEINANDKIKAYFNGTLLVIEAPESISEAILYNVNGLQLTHIVNESSVLKVETRDFQGDFYIVAGKLASSGVFSIKLLRQQ